MIRGKVFVSIFGAVFSETLENTGARSWREFFNDLEGRQQDLKPLPGVEKKLDQLEAVGFEVVLIAAASHFYQWRVNNWLRYFEDRDLTRGINNGERTIIFKAPPSEVDAGPDWLAGIVATQGGTLFIGSKTVCDILGVIAPGVECYEGFWQAAQDGGPLAGFRKAGQPNQAA